MREIAGQHERQGQVAGVPPAREGGPRRLPAAASGDAPTGGLPTNSPPANVHTPSLPLPRILASGVDTLHLSADVAWTKPDLFAGLRTLKQESADTRQEPTIQWESGQPGDTCLLYVKPSGAGGYEFLLKGRELDLKLCEIDPGGSRPNTFIEFRSELLHAQGPRGAVERVCRLFEHAGGTVHALKASRVDLFADILLPEELWTRDLEDLLVCRARNIDGHRSGSAFSGVSIGRGSLSARLYDKPLEIAEKSGKVWMFDVWGLDAVPDGCRIVRVEFELRRDKLTGLGVDTWDDLRRMAPNLWGYCTQKWLSVRDNPGKHHTRRGLLPWWVTIQDGFRGVQQPTPAIPARAVDQDKDRNARMAAGHLTSVLACDHHARPVRNEDRPAMVEALTAIAPGVDWDQILPADLAAAVRSKVARYHRGRDQYTAALEARQAAGLGYLDLRKQGGAL